MKRAKTSLEFKIWVKKPERLYPIENKPSLLASQRKRKKKGDFFDKLRDKTNEAKEIGSSIGKVAKEEGGKLGKQIAQKGKEGIDKSKEGIEKGVTSAKKAGANKMNTLELIEKLAKMKDSGVLTEKEFSQKKKELLENI
ncbi:MAG: SHOCT domain-containing protein [Nitrosopumilaceae archaeon]|nr:SHOCT domain-containing protein [Nitrosopumilaceae archaeon]